MRISPMEGHSHEEELLPEPSSWRRVEQRFNANDHPADSHCTSIYRAPLDHARHPLLVKRLSELLSPGSANTSSITEFSSCVAIKLVSPQLNRPPHDTLTEIQTLSALDHPNIVPLLAHWEPPAHANYCLFLPLYPLSVWDLLNAQKEPFHPCSYGGGFEVLVRRIVRGIAAGLGYLHGRTLAHRDINPSNVALTDRGSPVLIDFGTVWPGHPSPESASLEFELGTMPYRAPELLFGSRSYSPFALDIWAFGTLIAEFYMPMERTEDPPSSPSPSPHPTPSAPDDACPGTAIDWYSFGGADFTALSPAAPTGPLLRKSLFEGACGDIGLVGSIFKIRGTPDSTTWPEANRLPDFSKLNFHAFPKQDLKAHLPALSYTLKSLEEKMAGAGAEDALELEQRVEVERQEVEEKVLLIDSLLSYQSTARIDAFRAAFFPTPSQSSGPHSSWLGRSVQNEDQICKDALDTFFSNESQR
ncbi:hypothetical protein PCASD_11273 [Puccinia coronata f. sp. avenae]|uniref:cyclin-dependent kinase n=1 Tax=Puccinia coronata f. sp. avenae TaxID=200324 RepID=A0A2N5UJ15_9BASI|nr:hypothetical protein PCASD_11273 [Puccinia coronata f. sp. avenae]